MLNTSAGTKKPNSNDAASRNSSSSGSSERSSGTSRARKRKREFKISSSDLFEDCDMEDAVAIERKLRKIAKVNSLSDDEMMRLLQKFVKNEHILALVTLKAEDELAREQREEEQRAIIITETKSVPKLTRAKARELNKTPALTLSSLSEPQQQAEITALIKDDLHSDEDDGEYIFQDEDFISDDDPNMTASDLDSNPRTPQTPHTQTDYEDSPNKLTADGCFKIPLDKRKATEEDLRIATRTRSKFCLQQTTIEDIQSEFVPPDVEHVDVQDTDLAATDEDWMQFLNDFSKPLNSSLVTDDDDPDNDPEYVAAEKIPVDAEELRDVNISKKELTELVAELFEGLLNEGVSLDSIDLETPQKFMLSNNEQRLITPPPESNVSVANNSAQVMRQIDFDAATAALIPQKQIQNCVSDATISSTNITQNDYCFQPNVMSTPCVSGTAVTSMLEPNTIVPVATTVLDSTATCKTIALPASALNTEPEFIAVPMPDNPNCFQLAKVVTTNDVLTQNITLQITEKSQKVLNGPPPPTFDTNDTRYTTPYDSNYTWEYISIKKHVYSEYMQKFENLRNLQSTSAAAQILPEAPLGFTREQHDILQQQLRIHIQMLTQSFLQSYSHPEYWKLAAKPKEMLLELQQKATADVSFNAWNLQGAVSLITEWEQDLSVDSAENREMMSFINREVDLTNRNTRQIPRFAPRIMDRILNSNVFMYPQYLPRIPFTSKVCSFHVFAPSEWQLIAMGLEKHLTRIKDTGERISKKASPLIVACTRLCKDTVFGKTKRRVWDQIKLLRDANFYNPVQYFFEHNRAPPVQHELITFENNYVPLPKERFAELPLAWQNFIEQQQKPPARKKAASRPITASEQARASYLEFVREAVGEDITLPENFAEAASPDGSATDLLTAPAAANKRKIPELRSEKSRKRFKQPTTITINVNYVFGAGGAPAKSVAAIPSTAVSNISHELNGTLDTSNVTPYWAPIVHNSSNTALATTIPPIAYTYDYNSETLQPTVELNEITSEDATQRKLTDFYDLEQRSESTNWLDLETTPATTALKEPNKRKKKRKRIKRYKYCNTSFKVAPRIHTAAVRHRNKRYLQRRCYNLLFAYRLQLQTHTQHYETQPLLQHFYQRFKALELYTNLLNDLKMFCRNATTTNTAVAAVNANAVATNSCTAASSSSTNSYLGKRTARAATTQTTANSSTALDDDPGAAAARSKKANRQEENYRHMLLPDTAEDANRKDAIYAFNFYEKVEEVLKSSKHPEDCEKFNRILKSFDPKRDKVADLYYKMENLFLPEHPELAQVFLTFLLPSEAAEIGKFFEHFMITNASTFINKLNIYFNKQPAQIRKIYNCLNELAEDPHVTTKKVEAKILPLLKFNPFLCDWFMQQFPEAPPPERLLAAPEHINLKEVQSNQSSEFVETVNDLLDSPTSEQQSNCQLRYINGRIFYGSKMTLPAKLSFMASNCPPSPPIDVATDNEAKSNNGCIHGIRAHGEARLAAAATAAANAAAADGNSDDNEKSEEEDTSKTLIIDTTAGEEDSCSSVETCDDATLRAHAMRLNPSYYGTSFYTSTTSTPNASSSYQPHHPNAKKSALNFNSEDCKISPRKHVSISTAGAVVTQPNAACHSTPVTAAATVQCTTTTATTTTTTATAVALATSNATMVAPVAAVSRDKRKSPTKKNRSPQANVAAIRPRMHMQPMVVIHEQQHSAIACARKLKSLIEAENADEIDSKAHIAIVARSKQAMQADVAAAAAANERHAVATSTTTSNDACHLNLIAKVENSDDLEFLPEDAMVPIPTSTLAQSTFSTLKVDVDSNEESNEQAQQVQEQSTVSSTQFESDEDCKLDIIATLATSATETACTTAVTQANAATSTAACATTVNTTTVATLTFQTAWTRDEDKIILIEMKLGSRNRDDLYQRIRSKLPNRTLYEISARHQFLIDFLSKLQGK